MTGSARESQTRPRVIAIGGAGYLVSLDGTDTETSPSVMYDVERRKIGHVAIAASHLKMLNGYVEPPDALTAEERARIETDVARLLGSPAILGR